MNSFQLTSQLPTARGKGLWTLDGLLISPLSTFPVRMTVRAAVGFFNLTRPD
jgi:hypothetical protein